MMIHQTIFLFLCPAHWNYPQENLEVEQFLIKTSLMNYRLSAHLMEHLQHFTEIDDPELACNALIEAYKTGILKFSVKVKQSRKSTALKPWISPAILTSINQRHNLFLEK